MSDDETKDLTFFLAIDGDGNWEVNQDSDEATGELNADVATNIYEVTVTVRVPGTTKVKVDASSLAPDTKPTEVSVYNVTQAEAE